jgi:hypothetical protein
METARVIQPKLLPTENLETILVDNIGSPARLRSVRKEYELRDDKDSELAKVIG